MSRDLRDIPFPVGGGIGFRRFSGFPFSMGGGHRVFHLTFLVGGGNHVPVSPRYPFLRLGWGIVPRRGLGINVSVGGYASCPNISAVSLFRWGGGIVSCCLRGIPFSDRAEASFPDVFLIKISPLGGASCPDISALSVFRLGWGIVSQSGIVFSVGGGASCPDASAVSLSRWGDGIVSRCLYGISFPSGLGHRFPNSFLHSFLRWRWRIASRCLRDMPHSMGWGKRVPMPPIGLGSRFPMCCLFCFLLWRGGIVF